jgi:hypothetical protein
VNAFLSSLKADLLGSRLRAVLMLVTAALIGAVAYALSGGSGSATAPPSSSTLASPPGSGIAPVAVTPSANQAVAETTSGAVKQRGGSARDPFNPLPGSITGQATSSPASKGKATESSSSTGSKAGKSNPSAATESPAPAAKKPAPAAKPQPVYHVAVLFGEIPTGTPPQSAQLTPYENLKLHQKLPSSKTPLLAFNGVTPSGKRAAFKLVGEVLLRGTTACRPSATQCQQIALTQGQSVEFEYQPASGTPVSYELQVVSIASSKAAFAAIRRSLGSGLRAPLSLEAVAAGAPASYIGGLLEASKR